MSLLISVYVKTTPPPHMADTPSGKTPELGSAEIIVVFCGQVKYELLYYHCPVEPLNKGHFRAMEPLICREVGQKCISNTGQ